MLMLYLFFIFYGIIFFLFGCEGFNMINLNLMISWVFLWIVIYVIILSVLVKCNVFFYFMEKGKIV